MAGGDVGEAYLFVAPPTRESLPTRLKRQRDLEADTMSELRQQAPNQRSQQEGGELLFPNQVIGVNLISIYSMFCMYFCNLNAIFTPVFLKITLIPHFLKFCHYKA